MTSDIPKPSDPHDWDDDQMDQLMARLDQPGPPPDRELLDKIRERSAEEFVRAQENIAMPAGDDIADDGPQNEVANRRTPMFFAVRGIVAAAAVAAAIVAFTFTGQSPEGAVASIDQALAQLRSAKTLHLEISLNGQSAKAWVSHPGNMRIENADGTHQIVKGQRQWTVNEEENRATSEASELFGEKGDKLDALELLQVAVSDEVDRALRNPKTTRIYIDGVACDELVAEVRRDSDDPLRVAAVIEADSQKLRSLTSAVLRDGKEVPIVEVNVVSVDEPVGEDLFLVGDTLTEDGRIGKVLDAQGIVSLKPIMARRWTPVAGPVLLKPGDWLRTDVRGANAVLARLVKDTELTLGPGTLVEMTSPKEVKLGSGEMKIRASKNKPLTVLAPDGQKTKVAGKVILRVDQKTNKLVEVAKPPLWLRGFEGTSAHDPTGSLIAKVDGRDVPLTVGYHKVSVDIRDQIARTVIEESFVNRTDSRLEGVFYFPLPQDASISGFGMWIGNELVEADVVEKQRAREIYETILRERRDPGLLEWTGGNLFKARVFPIFPHSEKRIKITYTQVLPAKNNQYRYSFGLQSEMLKLHPLRELAIDVKVSSTMPLADVSSPTHLTRIDKTANSAHVEFTAQEFTPERDFEVVVNLDEKQQEVTLIPHRRGEDGYFLMLLTPPGSDGAWQRETVRDGDPLDLLILADTSGSMGESARENQAAFVAALLGSLAPTDRVNLATCDVDCQWVFDQAQPVEDANVETIRDFLAARGSLGWTDLDKAFAAALKQCGPKTQVIYVGDGVYNTHDADPVAAAKRLKRLVERRKGDSPLLSERPEGGFAQKGTVPFSPAFHAISVGSSFESIVMNTIASLGGGSNREITGERTPQKVALELLSEITSPTIRDLEVTFDGVRTARVYPEQLPNLAAGSQQILIGRYLPQGDDQQGTVTVTGTRDGKPIKFTAKISLKDAEFGNSFIPRLWARMHLSTLLEQGSSQQIKDEIIALSEEYHIITPYTSLLVLESDEDRERFKVKRRFQMRDGEKFFAEGRDQADFELMQKQMRLAGNWRLGLRRQVLRDLMRLGRQGDLVSQVVSVYGSDVNGRVMYVGGKSGAFVPGDIVSSSEISSWDRRLGGDTFFADGNSIPYPQGSAWTGFDKSLELKSLRDREKTRLDYLWSEGDESGGEDLSKGLDFDGDVALDMPEGEFEEILDDFKDMPPMVAEPEPAMPSLGQSAGESESFLRGSRRSWTRPDPVALQPSSLGLGTAGYFFQGGTQVGGGGFAHGISTGRTVRGYHDTSWLTHRFPHLSGAPTAPAKPEKPWPADVREVVDRLLRTKQVNALDGGLMIDGTGDSFDVRFDRLSGRGSTVSLLSKDAWLTQTDGAGAQRVVNYCDGERRGVFSLDFLLGRVRDTQPTDRTIPGVSMSGYLLRPLEESYPNYEAKLIQARSASERDENDRTTLVLTHADRKGFALHVLIDTERNVILSIEHRQDDKVTSSQRFSDFVELADTWWPTRIESLNGEGKRTSLTTYELKTLDEKAFGKEMKTRLAALDQTQFLKLPSPTIKDAKQAVADDKATFDDRFAMMAHFAAIQDWERVTEELAAAEKLAEGKPGMQWVRVAVQIQSRKRDQARQWAMDMAETLGKSPEQSYFLATSLYNQADNILEANERLRLLETLTPVFTAQPAHIQRQLFLPQNLISCYQRTGQTDKVLEQRRQLADDFPHNQFVQQQYANELANRGDYDAAYAWLDKVIVPERRWLDHEEDTLRSTYTNLLRQQGRYEDLVEYLAGWVKRNPPTYIPYHQYLSALVKNDQEAVANKLIAKWLSNGRIDGKLELPLLYRQQAAIYQAMGEGYELRTNRIEHRWHKPLAQTAKFFLDHETAFNVSNQIMGNWRFQQLDACRDVRRHAYQIIEKDIDTLPVDRLNMLLNWVWPNDPAIEQQQWRDLARRLEKRWDGEQDPEAKQQLAGPLIRINSGRLTAEEHLAFLKKQMNEGPAKYHVSYVNQYFNALLGQPWQQKYEDEAFGLLPSINESEKPAERLAAQIAALHRLTDSMLENRYQQLMGQVEHPEKLTRTELRDKQTANRTKSREGFAKKLAAAKRAALKDEELLHSWLDAERLYLAILLKQDLDRVADECWEVVGAKPPKPLAITDEGELPKTLTVIDRLLMARHTAMLMNLAVRRDADPKLAERLLAYFDAGIEQAGEKEGVAIGWKLRKYSLLIALDQPKELEAALKAWIRPEVADNHWRRSLAQIVAEQGRIQESIALFEKIEADDQLAPNDYRTLANWYMVVNEKEKHESALIESFMAMEEWRMSNWLSNKLNPWRRNDGPLPEELDKDVLRVFAALFKKSSSPQNYSWQLREFYRNSRDFRLLQSVADAVVGHTPGKIYPFLTSMESLFSEVREEATADSIIEHLATVRNKAETTVDHRALDLLELLIERRSSEVLNQPGPHVTKALAAMQRAFDREWTDGEPRLMADLLANLGRVSQDPLAKEQIRQLEELHKMVDDGTIDRLHIGHAMARTYWSYSRHDDAIDLLTASLAEFENANDGVLPNSANNAISTLTSYLESRGHFARGEQFLLTQLKHPVHAQQIYWLKQRLHQLYENAISRDAEVSLGSGAELYKALEQILFDEIKTDDHNHRYQLVNRLCSVYRTAHGKKIASVPEDLKAFAFDRLPEILGRQTGNYQSIVSNVAHVLHDINGAREGLRLLIVQIESEPKWFRLNHQDGWSQHSYQLGYWRSQTGDKLGDLEPRLLKIVLDELRRDLMSQQSRNRNMYDRHRSSHYWGAKEKDFHRVAEEVYEQKKESGHAVTYIAHYLWWGINRQDRAIEILFTAHHAKILDEAGQDKLVDFLHRRGRYAESIPVLLPLVETRPDNMQYRTRLMHAYFRTDQPDKLFALLKATDEYFHADGRWNEGAISALAHSCLSNQLYQRSVDYFLEVIDLHKRTHARQGIGNGTLSSYYWSMSQAYSGLKKTPEAVEAACAAIVSWGPRHDQRRDAISNLERVLRDAPDLPAYIKHLNKQVEETGLHNPIVRKALGKVFFEQGKYDDAIPQLKLAVELQPNDTETHQKLVACYDKTDRPQEAIAQLLASIRLSRRNIELYRDLGSRYEKLKDSSQTERAYTSIVEALPNESEGHALLAQIRQTQDRWQDSIEHLRQVAEIRALEPTGLVELAKAQIHLKLWDDANETCKRLRARTWPTRFSNIESQIRDLERKVEAGRKKGPSS